MKGKYKKTIALLMTLIMVLSINITAFAEGSANPSSIQGKVVEKMELPAGDADSAEVETQDETAGEDGGDMTTEDTDIKEEAGEEGAAEGEDVDGADAEDGEAVEGEDEKDEELEAGDGAEETAGEDEVVDEEEITEENGGEQEAIAENGQDGIDGGKVAEGVTEAEKQLDLGDNPDNITADEAYIENLGFYYPALIKMYRMMAQSSNSDEITWPAPGAINLIKTADPVEGEENQWEITLTVEGKNVQKTSKVVLVIDKSGSMEGKKMTNTILAAQEFVDKLLLSDGMTEIAVVSFDKNAHIVSNFVGHGGKDGLKTEIGKIEADGGTNIQAGIHQAQILLDAVTADNKVIVLLGDGEATYSYKVTQASGITLSTHRKNQTPDIIYDNPEVGNVDYDNIVGSGSDYTLTASGGFPSKVYRYQIYCNESGHNHGPWTTTFPTDNGIPTIWEAGLAKDKDTKIYSIALNAGDDGNYVLGKCQDSGYYELNSSELDVLSDVFDEIAGQIAYAANNAIVIDPMGQMFNLVSSLGEIYVSQGTAEITATGEIKWDVGTIKEDDPAIMKYKVMIKDEAEKDKLYPTNGTTTMEYKDINGKDAEDEFEVPEVSVSGGKILYKGYLVNDEGEPISEGGIVVARPDLAKRLYDNTYSNDPLDYNKTYIVAKSEIPGYKYMGYVWNDSNGTQDTVSVLLLATAPTQIVWFSYAEKNDVTVTFEENYLGASSYHRTIKSGSALKTNMPPNPNRLGYSFMGWYPNEGGTGDKFDSDTIVTSDITVYAQWAANTDTAYTVEHYLQNLAGDGYILEESESKAGTTGQPTAAAAKTYDGFTVKAFSQAVIAADGSTVVKIYYDRNEYTLTYKIVGDFFTDDEHAEQTYKFGAAVTAAAKPSEVGYTFVGWTGVPATMPAEDVTATGYYTANTDTAYTVEHYLQNLAGDGYILEESESKAGTTGQPTAAAAKTYDGFTVKAFSQAVIAADGSTVVKIYYDRNEYTLTYKIVGDFFTDDEHAEQTYKFGAAVTAAAKPSEVGYTFVGWAGVPATMPAEDVEATGYYTANTDTAYKVEHYQQDITGDGYSKFETESLSGTTDTIVTAVAKSYTGFSENAGHADRFASGTIAADGSLVLKLYYDRAVFTVTFKDHDDKVLKTESVRYGGDATPPLNPTREGYTFDGWLGNYNNVVKNETVVATYTPITNLSYTVNYLEKGTGKALADPKTMIGQTFGKVVTENAIDIVGYNKVLPTSKSITIAMSGNVITFYYTAKCLSYTVNYLEQGTNNVLAPAKHVNAPFGKVVTENAIDIVGYNKVAPISKSITIAMSGNVITFYYTAREDITYTVNYLEKDTDKVLAPAKNGTGIFGVEVTENAIDIAGYDKVEPVEVKLMLKLSGNIINFYYTASTGIEYKVKYLEQGTDVELAPTKIVTGKTFGTEVTEEAIEIYGFTPDAESKSLVLVVEGNVITFVYTRNTYTIAYKAGENGKLEGGDREDSKLFGDSYDAAPKPIPNSGYYFNGWTPKLPDEGETVKEDKTFIATFAKESSSDSDDRPSRPDRPSKPIVVVPVEPVPKDLPKLNKKDHIQYIQGYPDGTVKPEGYITRDEVAAVFYRLLDPEYRDRIRTEKHEFSDVASARWSNKHIATLAKVGIVTGYTDGTFKPGNYITRAEVATIASRFDKLSPFESDKFSDIAGHWANKYINSAEKKGWIKGYSDGTFKPDQYITRAEFVTLVNNVLERRVKIGDILPVARQFPDLPKNEWYYEAMQESINSHHYIRLENGYEEWLEIYYPDLDM